jgi:predicted enzyme related to lactoylglutathione lyase
MPNPRFVRYDLRTTDADAARRFYADVLGESFWGPDIAVWKLHEQALARGARPHWLGHVGAALVDPAVSRIKELGGEQLGPTIDQGSRSYALVRDPFGALLAVSTEVPGESRGLARWHVLHTKDHAKAVATYASLFGWSPGPRADLGPPIGTSQGFSYESGEPAAGTITDGARSPSIHAQWLYVFVTSDLDRAVDRVRSGGGVALASVRTPTGALVAPCDDPQGAAFGLFQDPTPSPRQQSEGA